MKTSGPPAIRGLRFTALILALILLAGPVSAAPASAPKKGPFELALAAPPGAVLDSDLAAYLDKVLSRKEFHDSPPRTGVELKRRMRGELEKIRKALISRGRLAPELDWREERAGDASKVVLLVDPGDQFVLGPVDVDAGGADALGRIELPDREELALPLNGPFTAAAILAAEKKLVEFLGQNGFPWAKAAKREVTADLKDKTVAVMFHLDPGSAAQFGPTGFSGLKRTDESYLRAKIPWSEGEKYSSEQVRLFKKRLMETGLMSTVEVIPQPLEQGSGLSRILVKATEGPPRTIKAGIGYSTDEGPKAHASWTHRNLFGRGESLKFAARGSMIEQSGEAVFEKPEIIGPNSVLRIEAGVEASDTKAYQARSARAAVGLKRTVGERLTLGAGLAGRWTEIDRDRARPQDDAGEMRYQLASVPLSALWDGRDDILDPSSGLYLDLGLEPFFELGADDPPFVRGTMEFRGYLRLLKSPLTVLALRAELGGLSGRGSESIPADLRFYAGGSGSIRGYAYQMAGPLDRRDKPLGGLGSFTFSGELRFKVNDWLGLVPFLDGGKVVRDLSLMQEEFFYGGGLGLRLFTPVGPVRLDLAAPLNRREGVDDPFQFYISLGQSF